MAMSDRSTSVGAALAFAQENLAPELRKTAEAKAGDVLLVPKGMEAIPVTKWLNPLLPVPRRKTGTFTLQTLDSFIEMVNVHMDDEHTDIFCDSTNGNFTAIFNSHAGGVYVGQGWGDFLAIYNPDFSKAWNAWTAPSRQNMSTAEFANFIDDHVEDVDVPPIKADGVESTKALLELGKLYGVDWGTREQIMEQSRGIKAHVGEDIHQVVNTQTGEMDLVYKSAVKGENGKLKMPGLFKLAIPVFDRGDLFALPVRVRFRPAGASIVWSITVINQDKALEKAIGDMVAKVEDKTSVRPFYGSASLPSPRQAD